MNEVTGSLGGARSTRFGSGGSSAALVLLYAPNHRNRDAVPNVIRLGHAPVIIGREPGPSGITLHENAVSRVHARVSLHGDRFVIADLGSRNGVIVDGKLVTQQTLEPSSVVRIGDALYKLVLDDVEAYEAVRIDDLGTGATSEIVGGVTMQRVLAQVERIGETPLTVLVHGETGTGKELVARALHEASGRKGKLAALNCAALPASLIESELFGVRKGAFTGADRDRLGIVRAAHGGTLFLDEIGDMPLEAQAKLLRMLQTREVVPVGAEAGVPVDVRVVCATHREIPRLVESGIFRGDLYARINGYTLTLPPLRERKEDLYRLVAHFTKKQAKSDPLPAATLRFMVAICHYAWPYNVRELESAMQRALVVAEGGLELDLKHLPDVVVRAMDGYAEKGTSETSAKVVVTAPAATTTPTATELRAVLARHDGNVAAVARELGKDRRQVHRWMRLHGISPDGFRKSEKDENEPNE